MPTGHRLKTLAISLTIVLFLLSTGYIALIKMIDLETYRRQIIAELQEALNRPVSYKSANLSFSLGPAVSFHGISVKEPDNSREFVAIDNLTFKLDILPLFKKQVVTHGLVADRAVIRIERHSDGLFNISDLLESSSSQAAPVKINQLKLKNAEITFIDSFLPPKSIVTKFTDTDLFLEHFSRGSKASFKLTTHLDGGAHGTVSIRGKTRLAPQGSPLVSSWVDAEISTKNLDSAHFWPYYQQYVPFRKLAGTIAAETKIKGRLEEFSSSGKISLQGGQLDYQPVFKQVIASKSMQLKYSLELNKSDLMLKALEANIDGADIKGSCAIRDIRGKDPRITADAITSRLDFAKYQQYIPYGIIVKDTADWIEQHLTGGIYQLDEGHLDGRISQILHMETGQNYNVLAIKAKVEKGVVSYGSSVPTFNNIKGTLEMKGKDFYLHNMSGKFGSSPMTLEGKITDYPLDRPSGYPFNMVISPAKSELEWLLGKEQSKQLSYNGNSTLSLAGDGFTSGYNLSGAWNLAPAAYSYSNFVTKPVGTPSQMQFKGSISPKEAVLTSLDYTLASLKVNLAAKYTFEPKKAIDLLINTNQVRIESIAPMSPFLARYQTSGRIQLTLGGMLAPTAEAFKWRGVVALDNASIRYSPSEKPVSELSGTITFSDDSFESSRLTAKIGNTALTGKATINSLAPVAFRTTFSSPHIDLADFNFQVPRKKPQITNIKADISFHDKSLSIKTLSGNLNSSQLSLAGSITDIENLKADLAITSTQLDISDLILLESIEKIGAKPDKPAPNPMIKATVKADRGTFLDTEFKKLSTTINLSNKVLFIQPLEANLFGGGLSARVIIDSKSAPTRYLAEFKLINASAEEAVDAVSTTPKEMTGVMSVEGNLNASGAIYDAMRKSAAGSIKIHAKKGTLRQFSMLSKVFSILNVSQLFKFKLPDMVSEGMPYNDLNATFTIKNGFVSTDDLFLASNAMNMSLVGKHDFVHDNMDLTLGIQPLQTVDKVVSHIPIVGWILTGENKAMFSTYFEIKGKSSDPQVSAIPITSLGKGVFGIFKRVFQLPVKLFTDTGEVILGN